MDGTTMPALPPDAMVAEVARVFATNNTTKKTKGK
jgi:hypothetical protein